MKKCGVGILLLFISVVLVANPVLAEQKRKTKPYTGIVQDVDGKAKTITVAKEKLDLAMVFDASDTIFKNVKNLEELKIGDKVLVDYDAIGGKTIAVTAAKKQQL